MGRKTSGTRSTPAIVELERAGVPFEIYEYEHSNDHMDDGYGIEAAGKRGFSVGIAPQDLVRVLNAATAPIATW